MMDAVENLSMLEKEKLWIFLNMASLRLQAKPVLARALKRRRLSAVIAAVAAEAVMVLGYFLYESVILGYGMAAAAAVPGNLIQALGGIVIFAVLSAVLRPVRIFEQK